MYLFLFVYGFGLFMKMHVPACTPTRCPLQQQPLASAPVTLEMCLRHWGRPHPSVLRAACTNLVELGRVDARAVVVQQQLVAEMGDAHGPDAGDLQEVLDGGAAIDVHGPGVRPALQQHLHQHLVAVPGGLVEGRLLVLLWDVWV